MNYKIAELISTEILEEIQRSFAQKHHLGACIYDDRSLPLTRGFVELAALAKLTPIRQQLFRCFYRIDNMDASLSFAQPRPIHRSYGRGLILRTIFPLLFKNQPIGYACLLHIARPIDPLADQTLLAFLERLENEPHRLNELLDAEPAAGALELSQRINDFTDVIKLFLEAGAARIRMTAQTVEPASQAPETPRPSEDALPDPRRGIFFCTAEGLIIDAQPEAAQVLGFDNPDELCDHRLHELPFRPNDQMLLLDLLTRQTADAVEVMIHPLKQAVALKLRLVPQKDGGATLGYECHVSTLPLSQTADELEEDKDQSAIGLITDHLKGKEEPSSLVDDLLHFEAELESTLRSESAPQTIPLSATESASPPPAIIRLFASIAQPAVVVDDQDKIHLWNAAMAKLLGIPASAVLHTSLLDLIVSNSHTMWQRWKTRLSTEGKAEILPKTQLPLIRKNASVYLAQARVHRLNTDDRTLFAVILETHDEAAAPSETAATVEAAPNRPTSAFPDLHELQIHFKKVRRQFAEIAEHLSDSVSKAYIESLRNEESKGKFAAIRRIADAALYIERQLAYFTEETSPNYAAVNINSILSDIGSRLQQFLPQNIELQTFFDHNLPPIRADGDMMMHMIGLLVRNAVEAMPGGGTLILKTARHSDRVDLSISDTGSGISEHMLDHLYHPFFSTRGRGLGKGLGLCAAYGIAKAHGAAITFLTGPQGTTVTLQLPIIDGPTEKTSTAKAKATILIIDDEIEVAEATGIALIRAGYNAHICTTCEEGRRLFSNPDSRFDLVILDYHLGDGTGLECARIMKRLAPQLPILFYTGTHDEELSLFIQQTRSGRLQKPGKISDLVAQVETLLKAGNR